jgi:hypothetical protein
LKNRLSFYFQHAKDECIYDGSQRGRHSGWRQKFLFSLSLGVFAVTMRRTFCRIVEALTLFLGIDSGITFFPRAPAFTGAHVLEGWLCDVRCLNLRGSLKKHSRRSKNGAGQTYSHFLAR